MVGFKTLSKQLQAVTDVPVPGQEIGQVEMRTLDGRRLGFDAAAPGPGLVLMPGALGHVAIAQMMTTPFQTLTRVDRSEAAFAAMRCVVPGTLIATPKGARAAKALVPGDRVLTRDNGFQPLIWVGRTTQNRDPDTDPIRIAPGALGAAQPERPLIVSASHRVLLRHAVARELTGEAETLIAARHLVGLPGVTRLNTGVRAVDYVHLQCARHEVIFADGAPIETLLPGDQTIAALLPDLARWVAGQMPDLAGVLDAVQEGIARPVPERAAIPVLRDALREGRGRGG